MLSMWMYRWLNSKGLYHDSCSVILTLFNDDKLQISQSQWGMEKVSLFVA